MTENNFSNLNLNQPLLQVVEALHFKEPTEIQAKVIPAILKGKSVIGQSHTGSGKTHAFLLPLFNQIDKKRKEVQFVITLPTRELAQQVYKEVQTIVKLANKEEEWTTKLLIGGTDKVRIAEQLKNPPLIIVGTPGRILDHVKAGELSIYSAKSLVVDEADLMLDLGFIEEVDQLLVRSKENIQLLAFSATIPVRLEHFFKKYMNNPLHVVIKGHLSPEQMEHRLIAIKHREKAKIIMNLTKVFNPFIAIIFTNGKERANELASSLLDQGLKVGLIHGGLSPRERKRTLNDIINLKYQYIVSTDLASRGIDIKGVSHVINADLPKEEDFYIHRVGRTARAGLEGTAISLYDEEDIKLIEKLERNGINFIYSDVKNGEFVEAAPWNKRTLRQKKKDQSLDQEAWKRVRKPKKVKPGYKKKLKREQEAIKKQLVKENKRKR